MHISCITIGEIRKGISKLVKTDKVASQRLEKWLEGIIIDYDKRILDINREICEEWGELISIDGTNPIDTLIAA